MADGAAADVGLGDLAHGDGAHDAAVHAGVLEGVLKRERVHDGREHAHGVALGAVHAAGGHLDAAEDVAAADDDGDLDARVVDRADLVGQAGRNGGIDAELLAAHEGLAGKLEEHALVLGV